MGDVGMHAKNPGERYIRSPNQNSSRMTKFGNGLSSLRGRAKNSVMQLAMMQVRLQDPLERPKISRAQTHTVPHQVRGNLPFS